MKVGFFQESEPGDPLMTPFTMKIKDATEIVDAYRQRRLAEEINLIFDHGGAAGIMEKLKTNSATGLSSTEKHQSREEEFGNNKPPKETQSTYCENCWEALQDTTLRILTVSGIISLIIGVLFEEHPEYGWIEGFAIIVAVVVVVNVSAWNDLQKQKKFNDLLEQNRSAKVITLMRNGTWSVVHPEVLLVGDIIRLENGVTIPADGILIESSQVETVESAITGENENIKKLSYNEALTFRDEYLKLNPATLDAPDIDHHNEIPSPVMLAGTNLAEGMGIMVVIGVGRNSTEGRIMELAEQVQELTPLMKKLNNLAQLIGKGGLYMAVITMAALYLRFLIKYAITREWNSHTDPSQLVQYFIIGITVLVVAIPEGLPLAVTISLAYSIKQMQKEQNLVRKMHACETMGGANMICSDKTGTLTQNRMAVSEFWAGISPFNFDKNPPTHNSFQAEYLHILKESIFTNSSAFIDPKRGEVGNKTEIAMLLLMLALGHSDYIETRLNYFERFHKIFPFSSKRKRSSIVISLEDNRRRVHVKGAAEMVVTTCSFYLTAEGMLKPMDAEGSQLVSTVIRSMTEKALRVIALAYRDLETGADIEEADKFGFPAIETRNLVLIGLAGIHDPIRDEVPEAVKKCKRAGITVRMVTGDNKATARAIAKECFIITSDQQTVMEGKEFAELTGGTICNSCRTKVCPCSRNKKDKKVNGRPYRKDVVANLEAFKECVSNLAVLARSSPDDKYTLVCGLKELGHVVAVTGDGTNDAPALRKAHIGFAMGIAGTEMAKEAAGIILLDDNFNSIVRAVVWGRNVYDNIRCFLQFQLTVNVVAVVTAAVGAVVIQQSPLTAVQLLWVNLIMDTLASLALATDPPTDSHLLRAPHKPDEFIIEKTMWKHILGQSFMHLAIMFAMVFAGQYFLPEFDNSQFIIKNGDYVGDGKLYNYDGSINYLTLSNDPNYGHSRQFTYVFNIFVLLQLCNEINSRKLRDELNVFAGIQRNTMFIVIWILVFGIQILVVQVGTYAFGVSPHGLSVLQWLVCVAFGCVSFVWRLALISFPSTAFPESGQSMQQPRMESGIMSIRASGITKRLSYNLG